MLNDGDEEEEEEEERIKFFFQMSIVLNVDLAPNDDVQSRALQIDACRHTSNNPINNQN